MSYFFITPVRSQNHIYYLNQEYFSMFDKVDISLVCICQSHHLDALILQSNGLFLSGGKDLRPHYYHQQPHQNNSYEAAFIDTLEMSLIKKYHQLQKPIFGICRGIQTINVFYHGTLKQDIDNHLGSLSLSYHHQVMIEKQNYWVNSFHHQVIDKIGDTLHPFAYSLDHYIEGIANDKIYAVQWHPEKNNDMMQNMFLENVIQRLR